MTVSHGQGHAPVAQRMSMTWESLREWLASPRTVDSKSGAGWWSPTTFENDYRLLANVRATACVVLDYDQDGPERVLEMVAAALPDTEALVVSTWSHMQDGATGKCRLVLPLARDVTRPEYERVWDWISRLIPGSDLACSDPSRMWHLPAVTQHSLSLFTYLAQDGGLLDPERAPPLPQRPAPAERTAPGDFGQQGNRHRDFLALAGRLRTSGLDYSLAEGIVRDLCQRLGADEQHHLQSLAYVYDQPEREQVAELEFAQPPADLLTRVWPPHPAVIEGLLPRGCVTLLASQDGVGKSRLILLMAAHIAAGKVFAAHPVERGVVNYVAAEDNVNEVWRRLASVYRAYPQLIPGRDSIRVAAPRHGALRIITTQTGVGLVVATDVDALVRACAGASLIVLDTLSRVHGQDENSNAVGAALIGAGERLATESGASVVLVHHVGKAAKGDAGQGASRGASSLEANSRSVLRLLRATEDDFPAGNAPASVEGLYRMVQPKYSYGPAARPIWLRDSPSGCLMLADM
jgi:hypothetical protein